MGITYSSLSQMMANITILREIFTVSPSIVQKVATLPVAPKTVMDAHYAERLVTMPNCTTMFNLFTIMILLQVDAWEHHIRSTNLYHLFADIPLSIHNSFDMEVYSTINKTFISNNHNST